MNKIVFTFGRFNPPTQGHTKLITRVVETARELGADHVVYLSQTQKSTTDPLAWDFKRRVCEAAFKGVNISNETDVRSPYIALENLAKTYDKIVMVVGSDQLVEFSKNFTPYTKLWGTDFSVISAGDRIVESTGVEGISATKMRQYARDNDREAFYEGLPTSLNENIKRLVYANVKKGLK